MYQSGLYAALQHARAVCMTLTAPAWLPLSPFFGKCSTCYQVVSPSCINTWLSVFYSYNVLFFLQAMGCAIWLVDQAQKAIFMKGEGAAFSFEKTCKLPSF